MTTLISDHIKEGTIEFKVPGIEKRCETWYKIFGQLDAPNTTPLVLLHGGPGMSHDCLLSLRALWDKFGIPCVFYDQLGGGRSTHLQEKAGDQSFWIESLFHDELQNLVEGLGLVEGGYDILGQSWGGMMGSTFAGKRPKGLRKLIISNSPADNVGWDAALGKYLEETDEETRLAIKKGIANEAWESKEYEDALKKFMIKYSLGIEEEPQDLVDSFMFIKQDSTVADTMSGPNDFRVTGSLEHWSAVEACKQIQVPTLVINGKDEGASDEAIKPFLDGIKDVKWVKMENSAHCPMFTELEKYLDVISTWLKG